MRFRSPPARLSDPLPWSRTGLLACKIPPCALTFWFRWAERLVNVATPSNSVELLVVLLRIQKNGVSIRIPDAAGMFSNFHPAPWPKSRQAGSQWIALEKVFSIFRRYSKNTIYGNLHRKSFKGKRTKETIRIHKNWKAARRHVIVAVGIEVVVLVFRNSNFKIFPRNKILIEKAWSEGINVLTKYSIIDAWVPV